MTTTTVTGTVIIIAICLVLAFAYLAWEARQAPIFPPAPPEAPVDSMVDVVAEPAGYPVSIGQHPCGCYIARTPDGVRIQPCGAHDPQFVSEWEQKLNDHT